MSYSMWTPSAPQVFACVQTPLFGVHSPMSSLCRPASKNLGVAFESVDVLADPEIRAGIKEYSDWPTIPQLYVKGEFIGGSDIMIEMYQAGELQALVAEAGIATQA